MIMKYHKTFLPPPPPRLPLLLLETLSMNLSDVLMRACITFGIIIVADVNYFARA